MKDMFTSMASNIGSFDAFAILQSEMFNECRDLTPTIKAAKLFEVLG